MTLSEHHLFRALKQHLSEKKFNNYGHMKKEISLFSLSALFFLEQDVETLPKNWLTIVDTNGDYIAYESSVFLKKNKTLKSCILWTKIMHQSNTSLMVDKQQ